MKILYAASEANPFIASGGLADVAGSLPIALQAQQAECRVILPLYSSIDEKWRRKMKFLMYFDVPLGWRNQYCGVFTLEHEGVTFYFLDNEFYFKREKIYGFFDDGERFAFFAKAVLETLCHIDYEPDVLHCNDWQTALIPVFLNVFYRDVPKLRCLHTVFTIHNIQYQGQYDMLVADDVCGLPPWAQDKVEYGGDCNFMKGAIEECERVTTVSPTYAGEILDPYYGHHLEYFLRGKRWKLSGILNGIDTKSYDPANDLAIAAPFDAEQPQGKAADKAALQKELGLPIEPKTPVLAMVTRLVSHKGLDLVRYIFDDLAKEEVQVVILGNGDEQYERFFKEMKARYPSKVAFVCGFIPALARRIYAGADLFLMPSQSEPCGLSQMLALRYGTVPIVRETGGLADSITDWDAPEGGNGFTFQSYNAHDMLGAVRRALGLYRQAEEWPQAVETALRCDFSWAASAQKYLDLYLGI